MKSKLEKQREVLKLMKRSRIHGVSAEFAVTLEEALGGLYKKSQGKKPRTKPAKKGKKKRSVWCVSGCFEQGKRR